MRALILASIVAALVAVSSVSQAGVAYFDDPTDTIEASGQTVFGSASTYEAIVLWPSARADGGSTIFNEWQDFVEDKYLAVVPGPSGGLYGYNHPVNGGSVITGATPVSFDQWHQSPSCTTDPRSGSISTGPSSRRARRPATSR